MDKHRLLEKLNWFYSLEINQVDMYRKQSKKIEDPHLARALNKFAEIEQGHVENICRTIEQLGANPSFLWEIAGEISGAVTGTLSSLPSRVETLRFNIALESKAISDYKALIRLVGDDGIRETLWSNMIDEELHTSWMNAELMKMKGEGH